MGDMVSLTKTSLVICGREIPLSLAEVDTVAEFMRARVNTDVIHNAIETIEKEIRK